MNKVVMDTNFLLLPYQFKVDIFTQLKELLPDARIIIPSNIIDELEKLSENRGKAGSAARLALKMLAMQKIDIVNTDMPADRWIFNFAKTHRAIVCTNDKRLRQRIKRIRLKCIVLKGRSRIGWDYGS